MNVLSFFDGMSCGQIALERCGFQVDNYFACEIDKYAVKVANANYPNTVQLGDVTKVFAKALPKIDLLIGGSPCQGFSFAGKQLNFEDPRSKLFFEFVRMLKEIRQTNPDVLFLLENVKMKKEYQDIITQHLGVQPIEINSNLVSAQDRQRSYWTNMQRDTQPEDKGILLKDIVLDSSKIHSKYWYDQDYEYHGDDAKVQATLKINGHDILKRVNNLKHKSATLTCCRGGNLQKKVLQNGRCRKLTPLEYERLQTVPDGYTDSVSDSQRYNMLGNGWTVDVIAHIFKNIPQEI